MQHYISLIIKDFSKNPILEEPRYLNLGAEVLSQKKKKKEIFIFILKSNENKNIYLAVIMKVREKNKSAIRIRQKNNYCFSWVKETRTSPGDPDEQTKNEAIEEEEDTPGPMYWYYLTVKILLWVVLQVKEEEIRAHVLVLVNIQGSIVVISTGKEEKVHVLVLADTQDCTGGSPSGKKEEEDQGPCTGTILQSRFYSG